MRQKVRSLLKGVRSRHCELAGHKWLLRATVAISLFAFVGKRDCGAPYDTGVFGRSQ